MIFVQSATVIPAFRYETLLFLISFFLVEFSEVFVVDVKRCPQIVERT